MKVTFDSYFKTKSWVWPTEQCSGVRWQAQSETIVNQHKSRISEINSEYDAKNSSLKDLINEIHELTYSMLHFYVQQPNKEVSTLEEICNLTVDRCSSIYTDNILSQMYSDFEYLIERSFQIVLRILCQHEWDMFEWSEKWTSDLLGRGMDSKENVSREFDDLMCPPTR